MTTRERVLQAIEIFINLHKYSPTQSEVASSVGISDTAARYHIAKLVEAGELKYSYGGRRTLSLPEPEKAKGAEA